jgi:hypothetical protein
MMAIILGLEELTAFEWIFVIAGIFACIGMFYGIYLLLDIENMPDEQREKLGFGPSGQGRGRRNNKK